MNYISLIDLMLYISVGAILIFGSAFSLSSSLFWCLNFRLMAISIFILDFLSVMKIMRAIFYSGTINVHGLIHNRGYTPLFL